jgi:hypothetical protein
MEQTMGNTTSDIRVLIINQLNISWSLLEYHFKNLSDEECLWRPRPNGLYIQQTDGNWTEEWPEQESYDLGPPNIAWLTWHIIFWWSMTLNHSFGDGTLRREDVLWPGTADAAKQVISRLYCQWTERLTALSDEDWLSQKYVQWPFKDKPFYELAAWLNVELMKNASELGCCRFLYATKDNC